MDLGSCAKADGQKAVAGAVADEAFVSVEGEGTAEDLGFSGQSVLAEEHKFQIARKMDLTAVQVTCQKIVKGLAVRSLCGHIRKFVEVVRVVDEKKPESVVGTEVGGDVAPGTFTALVVRDTANSDFRAGKRQLAPRIDKERCAHFLVVGGVQLPVVIAVDREKLYIFFLEKRRDLGEHLLVGASDSSPVHTIPSEKHDVTVVFEEMTGNPGRGTETPESVGVREKADSNGFSGFGRRVGSGTVLVGEDVSFVDSDTGSINDHGQEAYCTEDHQGNEILQQGLAHSFLPRFVFICFNIVAYDIIMWNC